jgi:hypothetical protein
MTDKYFGSHEFQPRKETVKGSSDRTFGFVFAALFALLSGLGYFHESHRWPYWGGLAVMFLLLAFIAPRVLAPLNRLWMRFGLLLHLVVSPIILGLLFYGCITPIGFLMRLSGKDPLRRRYEPKAQSYWIVRSPPGPQPETFKDQF